MRRPSGRKTALGAMLATMLAGSMAVAPAWAAVGDCDNGTTEEVSGSIANSLDGNGYVAGCSALAFDSAFNAFPGTCDSNTSYLVDITGAVNGSILIIITWNPGLNGTPTNQPETYVFDSTTGDGYVGGSETTCVQNFTAASGPLAVTLNRLNATIPTGGLPLTLAAMAVMAAGLVFSGRRIRRRAQDASAA